MKTNDFVLGLDLGVASIGWALADIKGRDIVATGARIFEAPMDTAKFEAGEPGGSHAVKRRTSRHQRRQIRRRQARHRDLYITLQAAGLLPFAGKKAEHRHEELTKLDERLMKTWRPRIRTESPQIEDPDQILCYYLRSTAISGQLELEELGRALYHLGQRRGFKSNRREGRSGLSPAEVKEQEKVSSKIKASIGGLQEELDSSGRTLGQHLALVNPHSSSVRNRKRSDMQPIWTGRKMYEEEFERIWASQSVHYSSVLTEALKSQIERLMFRQRAITAGKPGNCELERNPPVPRAPRSSLLAQHFRVVQAVNNLRIVEYPSPDRKLTSTERQQLISTLSTIITEVKGKKRKSDLFGIRFPEVKRRLGLSKRAKLNLDDDEADSYLRGNRTNAVMVRAFGADRWIGLEEQEKRRIVRKWMTEQSPEKLLQIARTRWGLDEQAAEQLASIEAEDGYAALSHVAMLKLLSSMEQDGLSYSEAVAKVYKNVFSGEHELEYLPPVESVLPRIPNPVVKRTLSEMRKVVNAIIRKYGRPAQIRIELARNLKRNSEQRGRDHENMKLRTRERASAKVWIEEHGHRASTDAIEKILLYRRCKDCLYCTMPLGPCADLLSGNSGVQVEHVLPRRCMDNSFSNKVLAHHACNLRKADRTPFQAFGSTPEWDAILNLVVSLKDKQLLDRFLISKEEQLQDFSNRHLSDTRYISKLATEFAEQLYGGRDATIPWEDRNHRCVYASSGGLTAELRKRWGLNSVLKESGTTESRPDGKSRTDHRHHAVDAIVIALTTESMIRQAALESQKHDRTLGFSQPRFFSPPWPKVGDLEDQVAAFRREIRDIVKDIKVSHRIENGLNGQLHDETFYSPKKLQDKESGFIYSRVFVHRLSLKDIESPVTIVDKNVRMAIQRRLADLGGDPKKLETNLPYLETRGKKIPIRKVRIAIPGAKSESIREGDGQPSIFTSENHHVVILERVDPVKGPYWYTPGPVTRLEAMKQITEAKRKKLDQPQPYPIIEKTDGPGSKYVMHLMKGDAVEMLDTVNDVRDIYIFASMSDGDYAFLRHSTVVPSAKAMGLSQGAMRQHLQDRGDRVRIRMNLDKLREWECKKVVLDPLGQVVYLK
jgi:CRISPR-associated endonuclease Csn1